MDHIAKAYTGIMHVCQGPAVSMSQLLPDLTISIGVHVRSCDVMPGHAMCCDALQWNETQYPVV